MISVINLLKASLPLCYRCRPPATATTKSRELLRSLNSQQHDLEPSTRELATARRMSTSCYPAQVAEFSDHVASLVVPRAPPPCGPSRPPNDLPGIDMPPDITPPPGVDPPRPGTPVPRPGPDFPRSPIPSPVRPEIPVPPPGMEPPTPSPEVRPPGCTLF